MIGSYSKHSRKFFFDDLTKFIKTLGHYQKENKEQNFYNFEELFLRIKTFSDRQHKIKDKVLFWVAHAKLQFRLKEKINILMNLMKETELNKVSHENIIFSISEEYKSRQAKYSN